MIYQLYGFNIIYPYAIEALQEYACSYCDNTLPTVLLSIVENIDNDVVNAIEVFGKYSHLSISDEKSFFHLIDGSKVHITPKTLSLCGDYSRTEKIGLELNGPNIIVLSRYHNRSVLHGSAFCYQGKAYIVLAPPGAGKSTLSAAMAKYQDGIYFITDDIICATKEGAIYPGIHSVNLNNDSFAKIFTPSVHNAKIAATSDSQKLTQNMNTRNSLRSESSLPLGGVIILGDPLEAGTIKIQELNFKQSFFEVVKNIKLKNGMTPKMMANELNIIRSFLKNDVFVIKLQLEHDYAKLKSALNILQTFIDGYAK